MKRIALILLVLFVSSCNVENSIIPEEEVSYEKIIIELSKSAELRNVIESRKKIFSYYEKLSIEEKQKSLIRIKSLLSYGNQNSDVKAILVQQLGFHSVDEYTRLVHDFGGTYNDLIVKFPILLKFDKQDLAIIISSSIQKQLGDANIASLNSGRLEAIENCATEYYHCTKSAEDDFWAAWALSTATLPLASTWILVVYIADVEACERAYNRCNVR